MVSPPTTLVRPVRPVRPDLIPLTAAATVIGALVFSASADDGVVLCPFRRCTGGYCPGCGATRAANRLVRGDIQGSWAHHPWIALAVFQVAALSAFLAFTTRDERTSRLRRLVIPLLVTNSGLMIGIWIVRLSTDSIPTGWL